MFFASMCFAKDAAAPANVNNSTNPASASGDTVFVPPTSIFIGKVDSVLSGGGIGETKSQITVEDKNGETVTFKIKSNTAIIDKDGKPTTLSWIVKDDKVNITYIVNRNGTFSIKSIQLLSDW
jgi:hypothetical protein